MGNRKVLTKVEVVVILVVVCVLLVILAVLMPALFRERGRHLHNYCGTNLKGLGTAMIVYANDYDGAFPQLAGDGPWAKELGFAYYEKRPEIGLHGARSYVGRTVSASWYLLVREADVSPRSFVCWSSSQTAFDGENPDGLDLTELWDFGRDPYKHVSYSMHNPYGKYPGHDELDAGFAVAGDMSPWFVDGDVVGCGLGGDWPQLIEDDWSVDAQVDKAGVQMANSPYHDHEGQNVLYGDGHSSWERRSDVGMRHDGIYTYQGEGVDIRIGTCPTARDKEHDAENEDDSFLVL